MTGGRRAITLIELLIVLAVALALGAVSLRSALSWSDEDRLDAVVSGLSSAALEARSQALVKSVPVDLVAERLEGGVVRVGMVIEDQVAERGGDGVEAALIEVEPAIRVLYELPEGLALEIEGSSIEDESAERIGLLRVMPDGSAVLDGERWMLVSGEQRYEPTLGAWTARLSFAETSSAGDEVAFDSGLTEAEEP